MKTSVASLMTMMMMLMTVLVINAHEAAAKEFKVGGKLGWQLPDSNNTTLLYNQWASRHRFHVGDTLSFEYNKNDSVLVVEKWDYYHCDASNPMAAYDGGKSVVPLDRPGPFYFISGAPDHCRMGQRLLVDVMSPHPRDPRAAPPFTSPWPAPTSSSGGVVVSGVARTLLLLPLVIATFSC